MKMRHEGWKPLLAVLNSAVYYFVMTAVAGRQKKMGREVSETDYLVERGRNSELPAPHVFEQHKSESIDDLLGDAAEDQVLGDVVTKSADEFRAVEELYAVIRRSLVMKNTLPAHEDLPAGLQKRISIELHGLITARILRLIRTIEA